MIRRLDYRAPRRQTVLAPEGKFTSCSWTTSGVLEAIGGGAWFAPHQHDFEANVQSFALAAQDVWMELVGGQHG